MKLLNSLLALAAAAFVAAPAAAQKTPAAFPAPASGIDRSAIDRAVRVQDDLYAHVNGRWLKSAAFAPDKAYIGVYAQLQDQTQDQLRTLVEAAQRRVDDPESARIGDLYASFMDEAAAERLGQPQRQTDADSIEVFRMHRIHQSIFKCQSPVHMGNIIIVISRYERNLRGSRIGCTLYKICRCEQSFFIFQDLVQKFNTIFHASIRRCDHNAIRLWIFF